MKNIIAWWIGNKVAANLLMFAILLGGTISFFSMNKEMEPYVEFPGARIAVTWLGASPQDIEEQIVVRLEEAVSSIEGLDRMWGVASESNGRIFAIAKNGVDGTKFMQDVTREIQAISTFPAAAEPAIISQFRNRNEIMRIAVSGDVDEKLLKHTAEKIRRELALYPTVPSVELFGVRGEEVSIEVSETNLKRYGLTIQNVADAVRATSLNASSGTVRTDQGSVQLRTRNLADSKEDFENIVVRQLTSGAVIRVKDVATVIDGFEQVNLLATVNGKRTVLVQILSGPNMDVMKMAAHVHEYMKESADTLPPGISMTLWDDASEAYSGRISTITSNFLSGLVLVFLTLFLFLRPKIAFWVSVGIATAFAGGLAFLPALGVSFNMISTFAFLLVIGVIVDDAIIVGEAIHTRNEEGEIDLIAAENGTNMVTKPVIFAVLTTMIFFAPWMFLSGGTSEFTRAISLVVIMALTFSLIESLIILPAHLSHLKPVDPKHPVTRFQAKIANSLVWFAYNVYRPAMRACLHRRYLTAAGFFTAMILSVGLLTSGIVKTSFTPESESDQISISVELPEGTPYSRTLEVLKQIQTAEKNLEHEINESTKGEGKLIENWYTRSRDNNVLALVKLVPPETRVLTAKETADRLRALIGEVPDAESISVSYKDGDNNEPPIEYVLNANDLDALEAAADDLMNQLRSYGGVFNVVNDSQTSANEVRFELKDGAHALGITSADVARQVRQGFFGEEVQRLPRDGEDVRVFVRYPRIDRESLDFMGQIRIRTQDGREIPLSSVANLRFDKGVSRIVRRERQRAIVISAEVVPERINEIRDALKNDFFVDFDARHPEVTRGNIGRSQGEAEFMAEIGFFMLIAVGVAYFLIAIAFRSYAEPLLILLAAIPFCFTGAMVGHLLIGMPLSLLSYLGISAAAGVAVNDNLVLLDYVHKLRAQGMDGAQALLEAGTRRFRPILLTSLTTFVGLVPLMLERSIQAQWLVPIGVALAFGVLFALLVTLFFVPALYGIGADIRRTFIRIVWRKEQTGFTERLTK
ncbi:MAG: RND transporter [Robiginitomaculum sp.]|nr:MAG: RND transporter [Robiginitomaculum sp.]